MTKAEGIAFQASIRQLTATPDGGWRLTLDIPDDDSDQMRELSKRRGEVFKAVVIPEGVV